MNHYIYTILILLSGSYVCAQEAPYYACESTIALGGSYIYATDKTVQRIYGKHMGSVQAHATYDIMPFLTEWINIQYISKKGQSIGLSNDTKVHIIPVSLGLDYTRECNQHRCYIGLGPCFTHISVFNDSISVDMHKRYIKVGCRIHSGIRIALYDTYFSDISLSYLYQPFNNYADLNGVYLGIRFGTSF
jgi:hypothetical protein